MPDTRESKDIGSHFPAGVKKDFLYARDLPLPQGVSEKKLRDWLKSVRVDGGGEEIEEYVASDFARFVHTLNLYVELGGEGKRAVEFGANPYFMSLLAEQFSDFEWTYSNWFGTQPGGRLLSQKVSYDDIESGEKKSRLFEYYNFNSEIDHYPLRDESYDLVLYCEIVEHLTSDPCRALRKIRNLLKPGGHLVLTTPNVARFENVMRILDGKTICDPYSGYGPYGRHNREYTQHELHRLITYVGFEVEEIFTSDVHPYNYWGRVDPDVLKGIMSQRSGDLGQYIFMRARKSRAEGQKLPTWLYRSFPVDRMSKSDDDKRAALAAEFKIQKGADKEPGQPFDLLLAVTNSGSKTWEFENLRLGARAFNENGDLLREFRGQHAGVVKPGETVRLSMSLDVSDLRTRGLELVIDLVNEYNFWFEDVGSTPLRIIH